VPHEASDILARTIWGEARSQGILGMECVACTILNRVSSGVTWWGSNVIDVCLKPWQYSCWNQNDPNREKLLDVDDSDPQFVQALDIADGALNGHISDLTHGADHYYARTMPSPPNWSVGLTPVATIGNHVFFRTVNWRRPIQSASI